MTELEEEELRTTLTPCPTTVRARRADLNPRPGTDRRKLARPPRRLRNASMGVATASLAEALAKAGLERGPAKP